MRDASGLERMDSMTYLASIPKGEVIVGMVVHNGEVYVSSNRHVYKLVADKRLERVEGEWQ